MFYRRRVRTRVRTATYLLPWASSGPASQIFCTTICSPRKRDGLGSLNGGSGPYFHGRWVTRLEMTLPLTYTEDFLVEASGLPWKLLFSPEKHLLPHFPGRLAELPWKLPDFHESNGFLASTSFHGSHGISFHGSSHNFGRSRWKLGFHGSYIFPVKEGTSTEEAPWKQTCSFHGSILEQLP